MIKVMIAEDHPTTAAGIKEALREDLDIQVVGKVADGRELRAILAKSRPPDILLLDIKMPHFDILEEIPKFRRKHPQMKIVITTTYGDRRTVRRMLALGVDGYVVKGDRLNVYPRMIHETNEGRLYLSPSVTEYAVRPETPPLDLSDRQKQILLLLAKDLTTNQIAEDLMVSVSSVNTHIKRAKEKLGVQNRAGAVIKAARFNLIDLSELD